VLLVVSRSCTQVTVGRTSDDRAAAALGEQRAIDGTGQFANIGRVNKNTAPATVDWVIPEGKPDWLVGTGALPAERHLVWWSTTVATVAVVAATVHADPVWTWWQWLLVLAVAIDVAGGVPANMLATAKRQYHGAPTAPATARERLLRNPVAFSALHLHPFALTVALPDSHLMWASAWYLVCLAGTAAVVATPLYLHRPLAAAIATSTFVAVPLIDAPDGLSWLGPLLVLKLVVAHAVREEPYRPAAVSG
jgi:hypothetical protein